MCREALVFLPNYYKARLSLVRLLFELNRTDEAIQATRHAIDTYPDNKDMAFRLFVTLFNAEQYAEAEKVYRHYLTLNTHAANADYYFGILALTQGRYEEAILSLQRAIKDAPDNADAHLYLAQALEKVGQTQEAMHAYRQGSFSGSTQQNRQRPRPSQRDHAVMTSKTFWIAALSMPR